jgi:hypothetical protein
MDPTPIITDTTTSTRQPVPLLVLGAQQLGGFKPRRGDADVRHLEDLRDEVARTDALMDPVDFDRPLTDVHFSFRDARTGMASMRPIVAGGVGEPYALTRNALSQFASEVLPGHGLAFQRALLDLGENGRKLADLNMSLFMREAPQPLMLRTATYLDGQTPTKAVRAVVSQKYATYGDLQLVEDLLSAVETRDLPVLSWTRTDTGMRVRLALGELELKKPVPMLEAWNSEVGRRSVGITAGIYRLVCTNGMGAWDDKATYRWQHQGNVERIRTGVNAAVGHLRLQADGTLAAYEAALHVAIDDAMAWMEQNLGTSLNAAQLGRAQAGLVHPTTTAGGTLASVIDAVTLAAQDETDIYDQHAMERAASVVLRTGLGIASASGGRLVAQA